jgi:hypothetical protein
MTCDLVDAVNVLLEEGDEVITEHVHRHQWFEGERQHHTVSLKVAEISLVHSEFFQEKIRPYIGWNYCGTRCSKRHNCIESNRYHRYQEGDPPNDLFLG